MKSYILNYRINGRERRATIVWTSEISLKIARERTGDQLVRIRAREADRSKASGRQHRVLARMSCAICSGTRRRRWQTDISVLSAIRSARPVSKSR